ncbi:cyclase family protein [Sporichthya brevicatena]|uniref:Cyclase family protein n=1 Tax=Sporichthya brevicatena TaxID=171442 RepID=A0ABN1HB62_9ACTN
MTLVDLSHPITPGMPVWPGDPEVSTSVAATIGSHGYNLLALHLGSQTGTHVDAPFHVDEALPTLDQLPLERFTGPAWVVDLRGHVGAIRPDDLPDLPAGSVLLLHTGWSAHWGTERYGDHPWLDPHTAREIVAAGIRTVGIDAPSIDRPGDTALPSHHVLARAGAVIAENLTNLDAVPDGAVAWLLPLPLAGADGAPVRAVAVF